MRPALFPDSMWCAARRVSVLLAVGLLVACAHVPKSSSANAALPWDDAQQLVLVTTPDWNANTGTLQTYARTDGRWQAQGEATPVTIGRNGSAWGLGLSPAQTDGPQKHEGDGRSPAGVFGIGAAFGYAANADTALSYSQMQASSWCVDVPGSPLYNRIVDANQVGADAVKGASETMRLDIHNNGDQRYREGFVIEHNANGVAGAGSCIFAHLWKAPGEPTTGCTAMAAPVMDRLYGWLKPDAHPVFVLLPQAQLARLRDAWRLP